MTVYILIVEDEEEIHDSLVEMIQEVTPDAMVTIAKSRDRAITCLKEQFFDFAILDLKIPTQDGALDLDVTHGHHVFSSARQLAPGMPLFVLTGSPSEDFTETMLEAKTKADVWGQGKTIGTVEFLRKIKIIRAPDIIRAMIEPVLALSEIELSGGLNLDLPQDRLIRIFARIRKASQCKVTAIKSGRSGASTFHLTLTDASGATVQAAIAKLSSHDKVRDECARYDGRVARLDPGATPRKLAMLDYGAQATAGAFYGFAVGYDRTMFEVLASDPLEATAAVKSAAAALSGWSHGVGQTKRTIGDVRRTFLSDERAAQIIQDFGLDWAPAFEARTVQTRWCDRHGDLHGGNILVAGDQRSVMIDYNDVDEGAASFDPVTLELSAVLHPDTMNLEGWPTEDQCRSWLDIDAYAAGSPIETFICECRSWAGDVGAGNREIAACAYTYLLRQLRYSDTDKDRILTLLDGVRTVG